MALGIVVQSIQRIGSATTNATNFNYTVTFSDDVTGVAPGSFTLLKSGSANDTVG